MAALLIGSVAPACTRPDLEGRSTEAIVAGTAVSQSEYDHDFPWLLAMGYAGYSFWDPTSQENGVFCGAVLITTKHAITAAHCVVHHTAADLRLARGHAFASGMVDAIDDNQTLGVRSITIHPGYDPAALASPFDIAVLTLSSEVHGPRALLATSLPTANVVTVGWGNDSAQNADIYTGDYWDQLQKASLHVVSNAECQADYNVDDPTTETDESAYEIAPTHICASGVGLGTAGATSDACYGDSGGPLVFRDASGSIEVVGLVNSGAGCAQNAYPGTYIRIPGDISAWLTATLAHACPGPGCISTGTPM